MHTANKSNQVRFCNSFAYEKLKKSFAKIISKSQTGCGNSQYNKKWIYSIKTKQNKKIDKNAEIPEGWALGRIINWDKKLFPIKKINKQALKIERHKQEARILFNKFIESDYTSITQFALHTNCGKGSAGLILSWQKYIPEYKLFCKHGSHFKNNFPTAGNKV
jgi:hypothetical protein